MIRQPVVVLVGHVDHGKSSILEKIKGISIVQKEAGKITQTIKAYSVPLENIIKATGTLLNTLRTKLTIPGLLFIDSPGHEAFTTLRKRGGNIADIAVLVIDINEGLKPQSLEAIEILRQYKTPFVIAANKIDLISGWQTKDKPLIVSINEQPESVQTDLNNKLYDLVAKLSEIGFNTDRFDRVDDYTKQISIIPTSAKTSEGIPELLMILTGMSQKYLEENLRTDIRGPAKATILEVTEEKGIGKVLDTIVYDGTLKKGDTLVIGTLEKPIITKAKAIFHLGKAVNEVRAASTVKISALNIEETVAGMPLRVATKNIERVKEEIQSEVEETIIKTEKEGVIIKANTIGGLEALTKLLKEKSIPIKKALIGNINKKDIAEAASELDPTNRVILGFNVKPLERSNEVKIITHDVIYKIIDDVEEYRKKEAKKQKDAFKENLVMPCKIQILRDHIFHKSNPAIVGVEVLAGTLKVGLPLTKDGSKLTEVKAIQSEGKGASKAEQGEQVAVSLSGVTVDRQIKEEDVLYSMMSEENFKKLKEIKEDLTSEEKQTLRELAELKRKENPIWGL